MNTWLRRLRTEEWSAVVGAALAVVALVVEFAPENSPLQAIQPWCAVLGAAAFLGGVVVTLNRVGRAVDRMERLPEIVDAALKFGGAIGLIAETAREAERGVATALPHVRAGGLTLGRYALDILPERARQLRNPGSGSLMTLVEYHYINDFLHNLVVCLPMGSIWLGVTHLTEGWLERSAEPGYRRVVDLMQERSRRGEITVLRIYYAPSVNELEPLKEHFTREIASGIAVRTYTSAQRPPDLSLIWLPTEVPDEFKHSDEPLALLGRHGATLSCGLEFATAAGRVIKQLMVYSPNSDHVRALQDAFGDTWRASRRG